MSAWLLLLLLPACVRLGTAEGDVLPAALVELVRSSPISSIEDLHLLLFSDSVESDGQSPDEQHTNHSYTRLPRSLEAVPAQQAACKVRTEVAEVTRAMLDRSNANFLLWPPCVEVQRCSGCCNTKSLVCVPVLTHTRYLQVMRIQYISKRPHYDKVVVAVSDHVECRCEPAPRPAPGKKKHRHGSKDRAGRGPSKEDLHQQDQLKHRQRLHLEDLLRGSPWQQEGPGQHFLLPDREDHGKRAHGRGSRHNNNTTTAMASESQSIGDGDRDRESTRGHRHRHPGDGKMRKGYHGVNSTGTPQHPAGDRSEETGDSVKGLGVKERWDSTEGKHTKHKEVWVNEGGDGHYSYTPAPGMEEAQHRHDLSKMAKANKKLANRHSSEEETNPVLVEQLGPAHRHHANKSGSGNQHHEAAQANHTHGQTSSSAEVTNTNRESKGSPTQMTNQWTDQGPSPTQRTNGMPESERRWEDERHSIEEERKELFVLHQRLDQKKQQQDEREEDMKKKKKEEEEEEEEEREEDLIKQQQEEQHQTTTKRTDAALPQTDTTVTMATSETTTPRTSSSSSSSTTAHRPRAPVRPAPRPHPHPHPNHQRRKKNRLRNRISKAAMRAMLL
ncbi:filaggrin [Engraulis encrasicolus]|uniref:filaggrin n=1 Tax=Engraulis encrasicolus TaxID=184585 RepID=UPI002FD697CA